MRFKDFIELFEMLRAESRIKIEWEQKTAAQKLGYFTIDKKVIYGIRRIIVPAKELNITNDLIFFDFGYFLNGELKYDLLKKLLHPIQVINTVMTEVRKDVVNTDNIVVFVAKRGIDSNEDYESRAAFYSSLLSLNSRKYGYETQEFDNGDEKVFCLCTKPKRINKLDVLKVCKKLSDKSWLDIGHAKRVLRSLK